MTQYAKRDEETWRQTAPETILISLQDWPNTNTSVSFHFDPVPVIYLPLDKALAVTMDTWCLSPDPVELSNDPVRHWEIEQENIPKDEPYKILKPIPVTVTEHNDLEFVASLDAANIAMGGTTFHDAFQALVFEILDVFDHLSANADRLGPQPEKQLKLLRTHLVNIQR